MCAKRALYTGGSVAWWHIDNQCDRRAAVEGRDCYLTPSWKKEGQWAEGREGGASVNSTLYNAYKTGGRSS